MQNEMTEDMDMSGVWHGQFAYSPERNREPVAFVVTLTDVGGAIEGRTEEPGNTPATIGRTLTATVQGRRAGGEVAFLKLYDAESREYDTVHYVGELICDGEEVEGAWTIPGSSASGTFLMIRSGGPMGALSAADAASVPADLALADSDWDRRR